ncbi:MAG: nicotinate-nucleotide adenylyltransferase [Rhodospirillales bacterium]|nr:nicotinate-nucleotide adenylyltransferase [Rhodospirillales bacterium]MCW8861018.1 nicotinate-nucleotide adenylyltransferase [Rhodospirillales bacterium]MCW8952368.1 nicotinate-nucleotide adenylyltransferase [Rhodospirillales bacterium]MCW8970506.1 nicotinate-nucleotide adenylyltransferase [Rhodospirillales bacterium]MCW9001987.1 nicotinate-nucleotide adenylyltransferase [Rhodospirillales bacterium]
MNAIPTRIAGRTGHPIALTRTPFALAGQRIGLLGGSFNPAHDGHLHISREALKRLDLDRVWWMVSPQNPLKPVRGMAPFAQRMANARHQARDRRILVTDIESRLGTRYTADTLAALTARYPSVRFVWIMGADNLADVHRWDRWDRIFGTVAIAIFDRPTYSLKALSAKAARRFAKARLPESKAKALTKQKPPGWVFLHCPRHPESATRIRARRAY